MTVTSDTKTTTSDYNNRTVTFRTTQGFTKFRLVTKPRCSAHNLVYGLIINEYYSKSLYY